MCLAAGVVPLQGQRQALEALDLAASIGEAWASGARIELRKPTRQSDESPPAEPNTPSASAPAPPRTGSPAASHHRHPNPNRTRRQSRPGGLRRPHPPIARRKAQRSSSRRRSHRLPRRHKGRQRVSRAQIRRRWRSLNIRTRAEAAAAADRLAPLSDTLLVEEMVADGVAEILIGMTVDPNLARSSFSAPAVS